MMASFSGFLAVVKALLAHNAQINLQNKVSMKIARVSYLRVWPHIGRFVAALLVLNTFKLVLFYGYHNVATATIMMFGRMATQH